jgi:ribosomal protein S18 acetylase RimI-like enzyme
MNVTLRKARNDDKEDVIWVESQSTPNLRYVSHVWNIFLNDEDGEWTVEELNGKIMGCGKYSILPDGTAWLETLRVAPQSQGLGLGKRLYELWVKLSLEKGVKTMRMYTGVNNVVSAGLARRYGFSLAEKFHLTSKKVEPIEVEHTFKKIIDEREASELLLPLAEKWGNWMVMNRTFYKWTAVLCKWLTEKGMVYKNCDGDLVVMGGRFMTDVQLHIGLFDGNAKTCLDYAKMYASHMNVESMHCLYPDYCLKMRTSWLKMNSTWVLLQLL